MAALVSQKQSKNIYIEFINNTKKSYENVFEGSRNIEESIRKWNEEEIDGKLNKCEQESLFLLLNSNLVYKMWYQMAFLNYIISHKKGWGSQSKSRFQEMMKNNFEGSPFKEDVQLKDIINNSYFMRMVFIYEMIKSIHLTRPLIRILPNNEPLRNSCTRRRRRGRRGGGRTRRGGQKGGNRVKYINGIMRIFKIAFCAVMWSIVCNNYYEKLETFGPEIESLITAHYGDVINQATINELENVRGVIVQYSRAIGNSNNQKDYQIRYNNIEDAVNMKKGAEQFPLTSGKGLIRRSNLEQVAPKESIVPASGAAGPPAIRISYKKIASICGLGLGSMIFGKGDQIVDMVQTFEGEITNAFAKDTLNIIKKKVIDIKPVTAGSTGNNKGVLTKVGDVVTNLYASIFQSSSRSYTNAPGVQDTIQSYQRRATALRQRWTNWQSEANTANVNFIQDIILHIRNTSYYLWVYFVFMQALELYAVKKMLELVPGSLENREQRRRMLELVDDNPGVITNMRTRVENQAGRISGGDRIIRGLTYWLLVAVFRGLAETTRFQLGSRESYTQIDIMNSIMRQDINPTIQQPGVVIQQPEALGEIQQPAVNPKRWEMQSSELLSELRRENDAEIPSQLLRQPSVDGADIAFEIGSADSDSFRTANGIRIPDEDIDVILIDDAIDNIQEDDEDEYDIGAIVNRGGKRKKKKTRKKKKRKRKKKKTRKRRR
tara:strand:+ start:1217 stop:3370 length:2154 start_codon:yes stop_codon:yes gene_type:complete